MISEEGRREVVGSTGVVTEVVRVGSLADWLGAHVAHPELICSVAGAIAVLAVGMILGRLMKKADS